MKKKEIKKEIKKEKAIDEDPLWGRPEHAEGVAHSSENEGNLYKLSELDDYEVQDQDPDVRGWKIHLAGGKLEGEVRELIVDPDMMKVRYIVAEFYDIPEKGMKKWILIPIGLATLDEKENIVYLPKVHLKSIISSPPYEGNKINRAYETDIRKTLSDSSEFQERPVSEFYAHDDFDERIFYGNRRTHYSEAENSKFRR